MDFAVVGKLANHRKRFGDDTHVDPCLKAEENLYQLLVTYIYTPTFPDESLPENQRIHVIVPRMLISAASMHSLGPTSWCLVAGSC